MAEWSKAHLWRRCVAVKLPWVRIPPSPPKAKAFWRTGPPVSVRYKNEAIDKIVNYPGAYFWLRLCDDGQTGGKEELGVGV